MAVVTHDAAWAAYVQLDPDLAAEIAMPDGRITFPAVDLSGDEGDPDWDGRRFMKLPDGTAKFARPPGEYAGMWQAIREEWAECVAAYESAPGDVAAAWAYISGHPAFWTSDDAGILLPPDHVTRLETSEGVQGTVVWALWRDEAGDVRVRLETGPRSLVPDEYGHIHSHDYRLDVIAGTCEEAILALAATIRRVYGNDRRICDGEDGGGDT